MPQSFFHKDGDGISSRCKACARKAALAWNKAHPEHAKAKLKKWFADNPEKRAAYVEKYKDRRKLMRKINHKAVRDEVLSRYGGRCVCCEESEHGFLTIDHVNNDGAEHRKLVGASGISYWLKANNYPDGFQILCMNCNWGKHHNGGVCPHVSRAAEMPCVP